MTKWIPWEYGSGWNRTLGKGTVTMVVSYESGGQYQVRVQGRVLKARFPDPDSAKQAAEQFARRIVDEILEDLG